MMNMMMKRSNKGFTMTELMATIAILAIVSALAFVSISQYQRSAYQNEMDETAKQVYIAAQNHLTVASSLGTLPTSSNASAASKKTQGTKDNTTEDGQKTNAGIYYYVVPADKGDLNNKKSMLNTMLPFGAIDETVRSNGSYIIRYQCNDSAVQVLDVFYSNTQSNKFLQSGFSHTFTDSDFSSLFAQGADYRDTGNTGREARAKYEGAIIGYYGGANASGGSEGLPTPILEVRNAEELTARLTNPHAFGSSVEFEFYAVGVTSGAISQAIKADSTNVVVRDGKSCIEVAFDSITRPESHFAELATSNEIDFIPGENIRIQVFALDTEATKVSKSAKRTTNSLFASVGTTSINDIVEAFKALIAGNSPSPQSGLGAKPSVAKISNIRHLENLNTAISGYVPGKKGIATPASYEQTKNLSWPDFCKAVAGLTPSQTGQMPDDNDASRAVQIYSLNGDTTEPHTFRPVDWASSNGTLDYKGNALMIEGVEVSVSGDAGLFGDLVDGNISNLELVDFKVNSSEGNAGALAGKATGTTIKNVLAHDKADNVALGVTAATNAGGLVGDMSGGSVTGCAAAVYVSGGGAAGGLIGSTSNTQLKYSYAGGHTYKGAQENVSAGDRYASNVLSSGSYAGGLVGFFSGGELSSCYSTCSVSGTAINRLVGNGATGTNCYAIGTSNGEKWDVTSVGGTDMLSTGDYESTIAGTGHPAVPYDAELASSYGNKYPLKSVEELVAGITGATSELGLGSDTATTLTKHLVAHYGDWPAVVTLVVNN